MGASSARAVAGRPVVALDGPLSLEAAAQIALGRCGVALSEEAADRCSRAHARLSRVLAENRHVYGLTTGFGPLANRLVPAAEGERLQQNLVHHLASGVGPMLSWAQARAVVLARLVSIARGASGASPEAIAALCTLLCSDLAPELPARGTVGASGDLTPLAHMVLCFQGRGRFLRADGSLLDGRAALDQMALRPLSLHRRDGLALVNGTSAMTGIALLNARSARRALAWSLRLTAAMAEAMCAYAEAWHPAFATLRPHPGQAQAADALRAATAGSAWLRTEPIAARRLASGTADIEAEAGQDAYTLRCAPQVVGAALDCLAWHDATVATELNGVSDNPIFPEGAEVPALHGGNFMGQHVALAADALSNAVLVTACLAERQIARLTDERLNRGLPAFLHRGAGGLNSGFMGAQVTASAILAEMRATGGGAAIQSLSTNGANQDVVSLGTIAARLTASRLDDLTTLHAILALAVTQALELRAEIAEGSASAAAQALALHIRSASPPLQEDRPLAEDIARTAALLTETDPTDL